MTRSIFDPTGGETERSGSTHLGPEASNASRMPPGITDGKTEPGEGADAAHRADEMPDTPATDSADAARRLGQMQADGTGAGDTVEEMPPPAPHA